MLQSVESSTSANIRSKPRKRKGLFFNLIRYRALFLMMLPILTLLIIQKYIPMFGMLLAFKSYNYVDGFIGSPWVGFDNFEFLFSSNDSWLITRNTVLYNLVFIVLGIVIPVSFAIALNELRNRWLAKIYQSAMFFPYFLSMVIVSYLVYAFFGGNGLMNSSILPTLGIDKISWYNEPQYWPYILTIVNVWKGVGMGTIIYLAAIVGIDDEYFDAAYMDGATKWQCIRFITLPLIRPVIIILFLLAVSHIFNADFGLFYQVPLNSGPLFPVTQVIDTYVYRALINTNDVGMATAAGVYQACVGFVLVLFANQVVKRINPEESIF